jgi:hypothetical protein
MGWKRRGEREYFYECKRVDGRPVTEYVGPRTPEVELIARITRLRQIKAELARLDARDRARADAQRHRLAEEAVGRIEALVEWALNQAGFFRHKGGSYRRRRMELQTTTPTSLSAPPPSPLRLAGRLERALADRMMPVGSDNTRRSLREEVLAFAGELAGPDPAPIVRAAAHVAAIAYYDSVIARFAACNAIPTEREARAIERAERRFHRAAKSLAELQKRMPALAIAIGQVNIDTRSGD